MLFFFLTKYPCKKRISKWVINFLAEIKRNFLVHIKNEFSNAYQKWIFQGKSKRNFLMQINILNFLSKQEERKTQFMEVSKIRLKYNGRLATRWLPYSNTCKPRWFQLNRLRIFIFGEIRRVFELTSGIYIITTDWIARFLPFGCRSFVILFVFWFVQFLTFWSDFRCGRQAFSEMTAYVFFSSCKRWGS